MSKIVSTNMGVSNGLKNTFRKNFSILNQKIVTNNDVKRKYIQLITNYLGNTASKQIQRLVANGKITPVECTNDLIKELNKNLKGDACLNPKEYTNVLGFYTGKQNRLYILMDNINRLMGSDCKYISEVTLHELQHMCCYNFISQFIELWSKELYEFYAYFLALLYKAHTSGLKSMWNSISGKDQRTISNLLDPDNGVKYLVQYLIYNFEYLYCCAGSHVSTSDCKALGEKFSMILADNDASSYTCSKIANDITKMVYDIFTGKIGNTFKNGGNAIIIECFRNSYLKVFKKDPWKDGTLIYQEMIFPSEVICVSSQYYPKNSKYFKFLNSL